MSEEGEQAQPKMSQVLRQILESRLADVWTHLPGIVDSYSAATRTAAITPAIKRKYTDGQLVKLPSIPNVRVIFPESTDWDGGVFDLQVGDEVTLLFCARSLDIWRSEGGVVDPKDARKFDLSDAWCLPGGRSKKKTSAGPSGELVIGLKTTAAEVRITKAGAVVTVKGTTVKLGDTTAVAPVALNTELTSELNRVLVNLAQLNVAVNILAPGAVTIPYTTPANVGATKVKAK